MALKHWASPIAQRSIVSALIHPLIYESHRAAHQSIVVEAKQRAENCRARDLGPSALSIKASFPTLSIHLFYGSRTAIIHSSLGRGKALSREASTLSSSIKALFPNSSIYLIHRSYRAAIDPSLGRSKAEKQRSIGHINPPILSNAELLSTVLLRHGIATV